MTMYGSGSYERNGAMVFTLSLTDLCISRRLSGFSEPETMSSTDPNCDAYTNFRSPSERATPPAPS